MKKVKMLSGACAVLFIAMLSFGPLASDVEARRAVKKISATACYDQESGQQTGLSNNCVLGDGSCQDNGCGDGQAEGKLVIIQ